MEEKVKRIVEAYIRGERTADEIRDEVRRDDDLASLLPGCLGCFSLPHELLEGLALSPFDTELRFERPLAITRQGLVRNLTLVKEGSLDPEPFCDWLTDWFSWHIVEEPDDGVTLDLAGDLMEGPERLEAVISSESLFGLFLWHLDNTPAAMAETCAAGMEIAWNREDLAAYFHLWVADEIEEETVRRHVSRVLGDSREAFPSFEDDYAEALRVLRDRPGTHEAIQSFLDCLARTADPLACVD